jgi:hypothetical protein
MAAAKGGKSAGKGTSGATGKTTTIKGRAGAKPVTFQEGGLHKSLGVPEGTKIPAAKMAAAQRGEYGPTAQKQANLATGLLAAGQKTAAKNRKKAS